MNQEADSCVWSTHPLFRHPAVLEKVVQILETGESRVSENKKKANCCALSVATLFLKLLFTVMKVILLYLTSA